MKPLGHVCHILFCDACGTEFEHEEYGTPHWKPDENDTDVFFDDMGWKRSEDGKDWCPKCGCRSYDAEECADENDGKDCQFHDPKEAA
jgi:hypothetical protein